MKQRQMPGQPTRLPESQHTRVKPRGKHLSRRVLQALLLTFLTLIPSLASAYSYTRLTLDGLTYQLSYDGTADVIGENLDWNVKTVVIPSEITYDGEVYTVDRILSGAFENSGLEHIEIPNTVTEIEYRTFVRCDLTSISIPNSVKNELQCVFEDCFYLTDFVIEDGDNPLPVGQHLFYWIEQIPMEELEWPNYMEEFRNECHIENLYIGRNISYDSSLPEYGPFYNAEKLRNITFGPKVTSIPDKLFYQCGGVTNIKCTSLVPPVVNENVFNPSLYTYATLSVPAYSEQAYRDDPVWGKFKNVSTVAVVDLEITLPNAGILGYFLGLGNKDGIRSLKITGPINGTDIKVINQCINLESLDLSEASIVSGGEAYYTGGYPTKSYFTEDNVLGSYWLDNRMGIDVTLPDNLERIQAESFPPTHYMKNGVLTIPSSVKYIDVLGLAKIPMTSVIIPNSVKYVGPLTFYDCNTLKSVTIEDGPEPIEFATLIFYGYDDRYGHNIVYGTPQYWGYDKDGNRIQSSLSVEDYSGEFVNSMFPTLHRPQTGDGENPPGNDDYYWGVFLESVYQGRNIIGEPFAGQVTLTKVILGNEVTNIESDTYNRVSDEWQVSPKYIDQLVIPGTVRKVSSTPYYVKNFKFISPVPPTIDILRSRHYYSRANIIVPAGSEELYKAVPAFKDASISTWGSIPAEETRFDNGSLTYRVTSETHKTVDVVAANLPGAQKQVAGKRVVTRSADIVVPAEVNYNGTAYRVAGIANNAFENAPVASVSLPSTINYIGVDAFKGCTALRNIECEAATPPAMDATSFDDKTYDKVVFTVPEEVAEAYGDNEVFSRFDGENYIPTTSVELDAIEWEATVGETFTLTATVYPADATDKEIVWMSSDDNVATVDQNGEVTILRKGSCTITALSADNAEAFGTCTIDIAVGINEVSSDVKVTVMTLAGVTLAEDADESVLATLAPGIYIVLRGTEAHKLTVK